MPDVEIKRRYEVLPDNNISFAISDVEVILDYSEDSSKHQGDNIQKLGTIPPSVPGTAKFILQSMGYIHKEELMHQLLTNAWIQAQCLLKSMRISRTVLLTGSRLWMPR